MPKRFMETLHENYQDENDPKESRSSFVVLMPLILFVIGLSVCGLLEMVR